MSGLVESITLEGPDGVEVALQSTVRLVARWDGLQGLAARESVRVNSRRHGTTSRTLTQEDRPITAGDATFHGATTDAAWAEYHAVSRALAAAVHTDRLLRVSLGGHDLQTYVRTVDVQTPLAVSSRCIRCQYTLRAPDPRMYAQEETEVSISLPVAGGGGMTMPATFPVTFDPIGVAQVTVDNDGVVEVPGRLTITGYLLNPVVRFTNGDWTRRIVLVGEVAAGSTAVIDMDARTVTVDGAEALSLLDFSQSAWFDIPVGETTIDLLATDSDANADISVTFRKAHE